MAENRDKLVLIDGHSILNRAFYGMPDLLNSAGVHTGAVYGFLKILFKILEEEKADYLTVAFDVHEPTFRHKVYAEYKGTRHAMPDELREQVPLIKKVLHAMNIVTCEQAGLEADDILGTLAKKAQKDGLEVSLVSGDRDLLQIADEHIQIRIPKTKGGQTTIENYYASDVLEQLKVTPEEFIHVKALQGDTSDNISGVPKVGPKTATDLIVQYHSVDGVYEHLNEITRKALHDNLQQNEDKARLSLFLATIKTNAPVELDREKARIRNFYTPEAFRLYTELGFKKLLERFSRETMEQASGSAAAEDNMGPNNERQPESVGMTGPGAPERWKASVNSADSMDSVREAQDTLPWASVVPIYDAGKLGMPGELLAIAFCEKGVTSFYLIRKEQETKESTWEAQETCCSTEDGQLCFAFGSGSEDCKENRTKDDSENAGKGAAACSVPNENAGTAAAEDDAEMSYLTPEQTADRITQLRRSAAKGELRLAAFDLKAQLAYWNIPEEEFREKIVLDGIFDVLLGAYLHNPLKNDYEPEDVASEYLQEILAGRQQVLGKKTFREMLEEEPETVASYAKSVADLLARVGGKVRAQLASDGMLELYEELELPLTYILYDMQRIGIHVVRERLASYGDQLVGRIEELEKSIHEAAGHDFNIASPKQLGQVLFEEMHLPGGKKTKSGYSTAADVLEKLSGEYSIVADVLEYRGLTKLKSTYADGLQACIAKDRRIHTTFNQTITATGRISSTEPNLQNIPMRTELGRAIRKVFLPREGYSFMDADYSQIELRILASLSGDEALIEAYRENRDIHAATAAKVFHVPYEEVTPQLRRNAKAVNFGIVYGISSFGLSQNLDISRSEAKEYIEEYFRMFPGIKMFLDKEVADAKEKGYSVTMMGRRRPIPELSSSNFMQRQFGERVAMNAPIQGTGADIMKKAMIRVWESLHRKDLRSRLILQIHDELLIETAPGEEEAVQKILEEGMMGAASLQIPLDIDCHQGSDWYEAK